MIKKGMSFDVVKLDDANAPWATLVDGFGILNFAELDRIDREFQNLIGSITVPTVLTFDPMNGQRMFLSNGSNQIWDNRHPQFGTPITYKWDIIADQAGASLISLGGFSPFGNMMKITPYSFVLIPNFNATEVNESYKDLQDRVEQELKQFQKELKNKGVGRHFRSEEVLYANALIKIFTKSEWDAFDAFANLHNIIHLNYLPANDFNRNLYEMVIKTFQEYNMEFS